MENSEPVLRYWRLYKEEQKKLATLDKNEDINCYKMNPGGLWTDSSKDTLVPE